MSRGTILLGISYAHSMRYGKLSDTLFRDNGGSIPAPATRGEYGYPVHLAAQEGTSSGHVLHVLAVYDTYSLEKQAPDYFSPSQPLKYI